MKNQKHLSYWVDPSATKEDCRKRIKTKAIQGVYDRNSVEAWHQLVLADYLADFFTSRQYTILNTYDFGYTIADHFHLTGYYLFVIQDLHIIKTKWIAKRKDIGLMMARYRQYNLIVFYPSFHFRYYHAVHPSCWNGDITNRYLWEHRRGSNLFVIGEQHYE